MEKLSSIRDQMHDSEEYYITKSCIEGNYLTFTYDLKALNKLCARESLYPSLKGSHRWGEMHQQFTAILHKRIAQRV